MQKRSLALSIGALALLGSALAAGGSDAAPQDDATTGRAGDDGPAAAGGEYVVEFTGDAGAARDAVADAGGELVAVNDDLGLALAVAEDDAFAERVVPAGGVTGVARNHAVGTSLPGQPHRFAVERPTVEERAAEAPGEPLASPAGVPTAEPLAARQWGMAMIGAGTAGAHRHATGAGVRVGIIDTGVDATHPDLAANLDVGASRNFTTDMPEIDGPCEVPSCVDPAPGDDNGHGTHVAGIVAADDDALGVAGVAPDATLVDLRAGQDSGYFFLWETVQALTYAAHADIDVVNMSFYVDPWLYNCDSEDDYAAGEPTARDLAEQALVRRTVGRALELAHDRGVTLVAAAGNGHADLAAPLRDDTTSPDHPAGAARARTVTNDCPTLPAEGAGVITVSSVGPSGTKADYSNYGLGVVDVAAPGGWPRDPGGPGGPSLRNAVLSTYPLDVAIAEGLAGPDGRPVDNGSVLDCDSMSRCGFYTYLQGTSMASPHVAGVAALVVQAHGDIGPESVAAVVEGTARDRGCPAGGVEDYTDDGRPVEWNAGCAGSPADNGFFGEGIVDAAAAVAPPPAPAPER